MKLLQRFSSLAHAEMTAVLMRNKGILVTVSDKYTYNNISTAYNVATSIGLWVVIDDQYDDAINLLSNPDYIPKLQLTEEEMHIIEADVSNTQSNWMESASSIILTVIFGGILLVMISYVIYHLLVNG